MRPEEPNTPARHRGFTLMETLVALGVASVLIATLIPISRNTLMRTVKLAETAASLPVLERTIAMSGNGRLERVANENGIQVTTSKRALPPFQYDKDENRPWQPVLITIETRTSSGAIERAEIIRLEPEAR